MNEFRRILHGDAAQLERLLLASSQLDVPPRNAKSRAFSLLGLGSSVIATAQLTGATTAAATQIAGAASATGAVTAASTSSGIVVALVKGVAIGAIAGSLGYGALSLHQNRAQPAPTGTHTGTTASTTPREGNPLGRTTGSERVIADVPAMVPSHESEPTSDSLTTGGDTVTRANLAGSKPPALSPVRRPPKAPREGSLTDAPLERRAADRAEGEPSLQSERATIELAQALVQKGNSGAALRTLSAHPWRYLAPEAVLVRIEALLELGRVPDAQRLGSQFLSSQPDGPYAQRVRTLLHL